MVHYSGKHREREKEKNGGGEGGGGGEREEGREKERRGRKDSVNIFFILRKTILNKSLMHFKESSHLRCIC